MADMTCCFGFLLWFAQVASFLALASANSIPHLPRHPHRLQHSNFRTNAYPVEVCRDRRYWKPLPKPEGVIGYGYNLMTGHMTTIQIFNTSMYNDLECRLSGRRSSSGSWQMYRLPAHLANYSFYDESTNPKLRFRYTIYNSTSKALLDARKSRSLPPEVMDGVNYTHLYVNLQSAPARYHIGARPYYEAMEDLAMNSRNPDTAAPVIYSLRGSATTGHFDLLPKEQLHWKHLTDHIRYRLRTAIVDDDFLRGFFDDVGTHYIKGGTFGGVTERWWISRRRPERKCGTGEESRILDVGLMAACDRFRLSGSDEDSDEKESHDDFNTTIHSSIQSLATRCHSVFDDVFRTSRWTVTSGAPADRLKAAHIHQAAFTGRSGDIQLHQWLASLNEEPSTLRVRLAPICDLLSLVDERPWHTERCQDQLLAYVKAKDPFYAGKSTKACSASEIPLKFEKLGHVHVEKVHKNAIEIQPANATTYQVHCVPKSVYSPERTCRPIVTDSANTFSRIAFGWLLCLTVFPLSGVRLFTF